jgi:MFS family permease
MGSQVVVVLFMRRALGFSPAQAGLGLFPTAAAIAVLSLGLSARLTSRFGARPLLIAGLVMVTAALALLTQVPANAAYPARLLPLLVLFGIGGGLTLPAVTTLGMSGATDADAGVVSGVFNTTQQVGGAFGLALLTTLAAARTGTSQTAQALTNGYHLAWQAGAILGAASIIVAAVALRSGDPGPAPASRLPPFRPRRNRTPHGSHGSPGRGGPETAACGRRTAWSGICSKCRAARSRPRRARGGAASGPAVPLERRIPHGCGAPVGSVAPPGGDGPAHRLAAHQPARPLRHTRGRT